MYTPGSIRPGVQFRFERYFRTLREGTCCSRLSYEEHLSLLVVPFLSTKYSYVSSTVLARRLLFVYVPGLFDIRRCPHTLSSAASKNQSGSSLW